MELHSLTKKVLPPKKSLNSIDVTDLTKFFLCSPTEPNLTQIIYEIERNNPHNSKNPKNIAITFCLERYFSFLVNSKKILSSQLSLDGLRNKKIDWFKKFFAELNGINLDESRIKALTSKKITVQNNRPLFYTTNDLIDHLSSIIPFSEIISLFILNNFRCYSTKTILDVLNKSGIKHFEIYPHTWKQCPVEQQLMNTKAFGSSLTKTNDSISLKNSLAMNELVNGHKWPFLSVIIPKITRTFQK